VVRFGEKDTLLARPTLWASGLGCNGVTLARADSGRRFLFPDDTVRSTSLAFSPDGRSVAWIDSTMLHVRRVGRVPLDMVGLWAQSRPERTAVIVRAAAFSHDGRTLALGVTRQQCPSVGGGDVINLRIAGRSPGRIATPRPSADLTTPGSGVGFDAEHCSGSGGVPVWEQQLSVSWLARCALPASAGTPNANMNQMDDRYIPWLDTSDSGVPWQVNRSSAFDFCSVVGVNLRTLSNVRQSRLTYPECDPVRRWWTQYVHIG
jgi:hypothetical protein